MPDDDAVRNRVLGLVALAIGQPATGVSSETPLVGEGSSLDSMKLVDLCLRLEDMAADIGFDFDWTSKAAMSPSRSMFRTAGTLAAEFVSQRNGRP